MTSRPVSEGKFTRTTTITKSYDIADEPLPFVVDGLVHQSMTLLYGRTCAGKSTLAAGLAAALANGHSTWLGHKINAAGPLRVGVIAGDPLGAREYTRRLVGTGAIGNGVVDVNEPYRPTREETWDEVRDVAEANQWQFVILDNLSAFVPGSLNNDDDIKALYMQVEAFPRAGVPVLILAHSSDKASTGSYSRIPLGSSLIRFGPRWWVCANRRGGKLHLDCDGNEGTPHGIILSEPDGTPSFDVLKRVTADELRGRARDRSAETAQKRDRTREFVLSECQSLSGKDTAVRIAERFGGAASTHEAQLSRGAYGLKRINDVWTPIGP